VADEVGEDYRNLEAVDRALREKKPLRAYQRSFDLRRFDAMIQKIADQAVAEVHMRIGSTDDLEHIVLVGGGAHLFRAALRRKFPATRVSEVREPLYANVRGFQLIGEQYVREKAESFQDVAGSAPRVEDPPQPQALAASQAD
jgi:plasmid segregation protein ParM